MDPFPFKAGEFSRADLAKESFSAAVCTIQMLVSDVSTEIRSIFIAFGTVNALKALVDGRHDFSSFFFQKQTCFYRLLSYTIM